MNSAHSSPAFKDTGYSGRINKVKREYKKYLEKSKLELENNLCEWKKKKDTPLPPEIVAQIIEFAGANSLANNKVYFTNS